MQCHNTCAVFSFTSETGNILVKNDYKSVIEDKCGKRLLAPHVLTQRHTSDGCYSTVVLANLSVLPSFICRWFVITENRSFVLHQKRCYVFQLLCLPCRKWHLVRRSIPYYPTQQQILPKLHGLFLCAENIITL